MRRKKTKKKDKWTPAMKSQATKMFNNGESIDAVFQEMRQVIPKLTRDSIIRRRKQFLIARNDEMCAALVKERDNHTCQRCGKTELEGHDSNWSHVFVRGNMQLRWNPDNSKVLCFQCHAWWHAESEGKPWFAAKFPDRWAVLMVEKDKTDLDIEQVYSDLKGQ